jgi:hypothetical protein
MGCEILFRKPKRIKDLVNLGVKRAQPINYSSYKKQYIEGKNNKKRRENGSYRRKV